MATIPQAVLDRDPPIPGLPLIRRGKVRDSYELPGHSDLMFVYVTDRISIFDFVLNSSIAEKGEILNALNIFWRLHFQNQFPGDLVAFGAGIDHYLPECLRDNIDLQKRGTVVRKLKMIPVEGIVRGYLMGSAWNKYKAQTGDERVVCGYKLPGNLVCGAPLSPALFTPTTKAEVGHDKEMPAAEVERDYPGFGDRCVRLYQAADEYARSRGVIVLDTKVEGDLQVFGDELPTMDSSRFCTKAAYEKATKEGKTPPSIDKQFVRNEGIKAGIQTRPDGVERDPDDPADIAFVHRWVVPEWVRLMTSGLYRYPFWLLTGQKKELFQRDVMGINVSDRKPKITVLIGSRSDIPQVRDGIRLLENAGADYTLNVLSCDRNPEELRDFCRTTDADVIIAGAGKAARLPGSVKANLCAFGRPDIHVLGVGFTGKSDKETLAAKISIEELPGQPVELFKEDTAYSGSEGFTNACAAALHDEFLPKTIEAKPPEMGIRI